MQVKKLEPDFGYPARSQADIDQLSEELRRIKARLKKIKTDKQKASATELDRQRQIASKYARDEDVLTHNENLLKRNLLEALSYAEEEQEAALQMAREAYERNDKDAAAKYTIQAASKEWELPGHISIRKKNSFIPIDISKVPAEFLLLNESALREALQKNPDTPIPGLKIIQLNSIAVSTKGGDNEYANS